MNRWARTAAATAMMACGLGGVGCASVGGEKSATADPVARGAAPDTGCAAGGCETGGCAGGLCGKGSDRGGVTERLSHLYDPSWPDRYAYSARKSVLAPFAIQVHNAEIIDQTLWNYFFVPETDTLTPAGIERLDYIVRRRPAPMSKLYLQTATDLNYDPAKPDKYVSDRLQLNEKRAQAILRYVAIQTTGRPVNFDVTVIDAPDPSISAVGPANSIRGLVGQYRSGITGAASGTVTGVGGAAATQVQSTGGAPTGGGR